MLVGLLTVVGACGGTDGDESSGGGDSPSSTEPAPSSTEPAVEYSSPVVAAWEMDEEEGATTLVDSGPDGLDGRVGAEVRVGVEEQGATGHRWVVVEPDALPVAIERLTQVPHDDRLNPGDDDVAITVRLRTTSPQGNVVQKGQVDVPGGYFKIDMDEGRVACLFFGSEGSANVRSKEAIDDGAWHEVRCVRRADGMALYVDGEQAASREAVTGTVSNTYPLTIGGKLDCDQVTLFCDYFSGDVDRVLLERSSSPTTPTTSVRERDT
jgi:hypothetical protein